MDPDKDTGKTDCVEEKCGEAEGTAAYRSCIQCDELLLAGDASSAQRCYRRCTISESDAEQTENIGLPVRCSIDVEDSMQLSVSDIGSMGKPPREKVAPLLGQLHAERWSMRSNHLSAALRIKPVLGLLSDPVDISEFLHHYMLEVWSAGCRHAFATAFELAQSQRKGFWRHPLQIPKAGCLGENDPHPWHDPSEYDATKPLEDRWKEILKEVEAVDNANESGGFVSNQEDATLVYSGQWKEIRLYNQGTNIWDKDGCNLLPTTCEILQDIPSIRATVPAADGVARTPGVVSVFRLQPGASLVPHTGPNNLRITLHLGLSIPSSPAPFISVGGEKRSWQAGTVIAFDDAFIHSVTNPHPTDTRTVLLLNVWKASFCAQHGCSVDD